MYTKDMYLTDPPDCACGVDYFDSMAHRPDCHCYAGPSAHAGPDPRDDQGTRTPGAGAARL
ncbi:hypothetical protein [Streptomyces sp. NPDC059957]|uniref:hypothetical protein n=1 Tax=unclassified Streptomyces TaxID=2593676 RepID=UPI00365F607B